MLCYVVFFFKQKTAYEMRISDWSSDVCSSDLGFDQPGATQPFLALDLPFADAIFGQAVKLWDGVELTQPDMLLALSFSFLALVLVNGLFKLVINTRKGRLGERLLRRLRFELADRILRFPLPHLRRVKRSEEHTSELQ